MAKVYSVFEAKTHLSELLRIVKSGKDVTVSERGKAIARVVPYREVSDETLEQRLNRFEHSGNLLRRKLRERTDIGTRRKGALKRFLDDRE